MFKANENYLKLPGSYLFSTVGRKQREYSAAHPDKKVIRHSRDMLLISAMSSSETP